MGIPRRLIELFGNGRVEGELLGLTASGDRLLGVVVRRLGWSGCEDGNDSSSYRRDDCFEHLNNSRWHGENSLVVGVLFLYQGEG